MNEYVIWGKAPGTDEEDLLVTRFKDEPITSLTVAKALLKTLETKYGCRECRIQTIDGSPPDFTKALNI